MIQIDKATGILTSTLKSSKVVFAPLTGIDLADYNGYERRGLTGEELRQYQQSKQRHPLQDQLNESVISINREISRHNAKNAMFTPYTATLVHKKYHGKYLHYYNNLNDGCHLTDDAKQYWASEILKCVRKCRLPPTCDDNKPELGV